MAPRPANPAFNRTWDLIASKRLGKECAITSEQPADKWVIRPSLWFDSLCLIPLLADIPFYTSRHIEDVAWWQDRFASAASERAREDLVYLRSQVTDRAGKPLPAFLALWTSPLATSPLQSLDELISALDKPDRLAQRMREISDHWSGGDEQLFLTVCGSVRSVLTALRDLGLFDWWATSAEPLLQRRCAELTKALGSYDLVPLVERHTGIALPSRKVELCVLRWAAPHAIRVTGVRFLGDVRYSEQVILSNALHELLHPPWPNDHPATRALLGMATDPFLQQRFTARNPDAGYNTWEGYIEEDAAQALDQVLATGLGMATKDPVSRWTEADDGLHVLALLLHDTLQRGGFEPGLESYADFLARALTDEQLWPKDLEMRYLELTTPG
ncbi:MAG: hypothetical protein WBA31_06300 [Candidatus Dormiibacterota bacterium]